jgi:ABC-type dipeptide/oligopeptide/nickel transport system permease subunit
MITQQPKSGRSQWSDAYRRLRRDPISIACLAVIACYALIAILSPLILSGWDATYNYELLYRTPFTEFLLGSDGLGRSVAQKTLLGAHVSMTVGFMANIIAIPFGLFLGAFAGFFGRRIDDVIVWFYTTMSSIPSIILLIALKFAFADKKIFVATPFEIDLAGMAGVYIAIGIISWVSTCRLVRAETMKLKELDFVAAARASGSSDFRIIMRHIVPNVVHIAIINFSLGFVGAINAEVILSFLNLGVQDLPSWGRMINDARMDLVVGRWWELVSATTAMFIIVLAWNIFGDRLRDALDPKLK